MSRLSDLPIAGKHMKRSVQYSTGLHLLLVGLLLLLSVTSQQRIEALTRLKQERVEQEKKEKLEDAVAEQQIEQDLKEVLADLNPEADAKEIEALQAALEEQMDTERLKEDVIASMNEEDPEQQERQESYLNKLQEELSAHLPAAIQATEDDVLEQRLLEELVYEDLPDVDNNIENALKRDDLEDLAQQALAEKADAVAALTRTQINRERSESQRGQERDKIHKAKREALQEQLKRAHDSEAPKETVLEAVQELTQHSQEQLAILRQQNPYTDEALQIPVQDSQNALQDAETEWTQAIKQEQAARAEFEKSGQAAIQQLTDTLAEHRADAGVQKAQATTKRLAQEAQARLQDKQRKTQDATAKINELQAHAQRVLKDRLTAAQAQSNAAQVKQAHQARADHQRAREQLVKKRNEVMRRALQHHQQVLKEADQLQRRFARTKSLEEPMSALKKQLDAHRRQGTPKDAEQLHKLQQATAALDQARKTFAQAVNQERTQSLASTERALQELQALTRDVAALQGLNQEQQRDATIAAIKETMLSERIAQKAEHLHKQLRQGTDSEKKQRAEQFQLTASDAVSAAQQQQAEKSATVKGAADEASTEQKQTLPHLSMSASLQNILAQKIDRVSTRAEQDDKAEKHSDETPIQAAVSSGFRGIEVDAKALGQRLHSRWQFRKLSLAEKKEILVRNAVSALAQPPPVLRFARPTLDAAKENERVGSADVYVGQISKREIASLDPNRPRQSHPQFQKTDFSAVPFCQSIPTLDGDPSDWDLERTRLHAGKDVFMQWRPDGLYVLALIRDKSGSFEQAAIEQMQQNFWDYDTMEIWFDMKNSKAKKTDQHACQQFWACPKLPGIERDHQLWEIVWGAHGRKLLRSGPGKPYIGSRVHDDQRGYNLEYFIPRALLTNLNYFRAGQVLGFLYVINSSHNPEHMQSSLEHFNPHFHYSSQPSSWGNLQLLGTDAVLHTLTASGEAAEYPSVEVSQSLGLMVTDPDSNTDIGAVNAVTVRVKNRYGFDGRERDADGVELGDWEDVRLLETGKNTGVFKGWVSTTLLPSATGDQKVGVQPGDKLDVLYSDYVRMAGEYDEKMQVEVAVVSPILQVTGAQRSTGAE